MADVRYGLRNGDLTTTGGVIFATGKMRFHGKEVAAEGDLATCPACKAMGKIVNDAYPAFGLPGGRQLAIQGAWIFCKCANPPRTIASTDKFRVTVNRAGSAAPAPASARPSFAVPQAEQNAYAQRGMEKLTGTQSSLIDDPELICPNMTDAQFGKHMMGLRDDALVQVDDRLRQLARWSQADQAWFLCGLAQRIKRHGQPLRMA
ncbi:PAAR domain-containing protein [Ralstonia sp. SET104]|uniref:PAAR domain-containing protein n=1 Tax=Ralstonia sp. SET104 TaxID=2448774 RepID=UPI000F5738F2|nr:PAAR domain-containing protein [Ralstonia sp. SET104]GCB06563.1 hypothetical protein PSUB009319_41940 [Ralstonia sp. SET104]